MNQQQKRLTAPSLDLDTVMRGKSKELLGLKRSSSVQSRKYLTVPFNIAYLNGGNNVKDMAIP
jgi:hypothetical protein